MGSTREGVPQTNYFTGQPIRGSVCSGTASYGMGSSKSVEGVTVFDNLNAIMMQCMQVQNDAGEVAGLMKARMEVNGGRYKLESGIRKSSILWQCDIGERLKSVHGMCLKLCVLKTV